MMFFDQTKCTRKNIQIEKVITLCNAWQLVRHINSMVFLTLTKMQDWQVSSTMRSINKATPKITRHSKDKMEIILPIAIQ